jgi:hypothetical protein
MICAAPILKKDAPGGGTTVLRVVHVAHTIVRDLPIGGARLRADTVDEASGTDSTA